jgi:hypothetical protein
LVSIEERISLCHRQIHPLWDPVQTIIRSWQIHASGSTFSAGPLAEKKPQTIQWSMPSQRRAISRTCISWHSRIAPRAAGAYPLDRISYLADPAYIGRFELNPMHAVPVAKAG